MRYFTHFITLALFLLSYSSAAQDFTISSADVKHFIETYDKIEEYWVNKSKELSSMTTPNISKIKRVEKEMKAAPTKFGWESREIYEQVELAVKSIRNYFIYQENADASNDEFAADRKKDAVALRKEVVATYGESSLAAVKAHRAALDKLLE